MHHVATLYPFSVMKTNVVYSKKYLSIGTERHMGRSLQVSFWVGYALFMGAIRKERPANQPARRSVTNFLPFLSGSGEKRQPCQSRSTGLASEQPVIVARQTATPEFAQRKERNNNSIGSKFLRSRGFFQEAPCGFGQSPRSSPYSFPSLFVIFPIRSERSMPVACFRPSTT